MKKYKKKHKQKHFDMAKFEKERAEGKQQSRGQGGSNVPVYYKERKRRDGAMK